MFTIYDWITGIWRGRRGPGKPSFGGAGATVEWADPIPRTTRGLRNRNPGNLRGGPVKWLGETGRDRDDFCVFDSDDSGLRAAGKVLLTYRVRHGLDCIEEIISRWAPSSENNTRAYVDAVSRSMNVPPMMLLDVHDVGVLAPLMAAIVKHENGTQPYPMDQIIAAANRAIRGE